MLRKYRNVERNASSSREAFRHNLPGSEPSALCVSCFRLLALGAALLATLVLPVRIARPPSPVAGAMPLSADLVAACGTHPTTADILVAQLERIGLLDVITLLSFRASFMAPAPLADADIAVLQTALRGDAPTEASFPNGAPGVVALRVVLHAARLRWRAIEAATAAAAAPGPGPAPAPAPADDHDLFKALPPSDIRAIWEGGEIATRGLSWVPDRFRLADSLVSRMHRANKAGAPIILTSCSAFSPQTDRQTE